MIRRAAITAVILCLLAPAPSWGITIGFGLEFGGGGPFDTGPFPLSSPAVNINVHAVPTFDGTTTQFNLCGACTLSYTLGPRFLPSILGSTRYKKPSQVARLQLQEILILQTLVSCILGRRHF